MTDNSMQFNGDRNGAGVAVNPEDLAGVTHNTTNIDMLMDVSMQVTVELGRTRMTLRQVLDLQNGSVVELDRLAGDPVDVFVNERLIARGEVVVVDDKFGVRINELVGSNGDVPDK